MNTINVLQEYYGSTSTLKFKVDVFSFLIDNILNDNLITRFLIEMKDQDLETKSNIPHSNQTTVLLHNRLTNKLIKPKRKKKKKKKLSIKIETT